MPTIIDELVTIVRLDPRPFTEGQRQVAQELGRLKSATQSAASSVQQNASRPLRSYMADLHNELKDVNLQLLNLGANSRRSGQAVRSGGMAGAEGLNNLAAAGLAAFAAVKSVQETISKLGEVSRGAFNTSFTARFGNVPQGWLQQLQIANQTVGNVPHERTQSAVLAFEQARAQFRLTGQYPAEFQGLARWFSQNLPGVDLANAPLQQIFSGLAQGARGRNGPELLAQLQASGFGDFATLFSSGRYGSAMEGAKNLTLSNDQINSLNKLGEAARRASEAWDKLISSVVAAHPEWAQRIEEFNNLSTALGNNADAMRLVGDVAELVFGTVMIKAIQKFVTFLVGANATVAALPLARLFGIGWALSEIGAFTPPIPHYGQEEADKRLQNAPGPSGYRRPQGWEWANPFNWFNGIPTGTTSGSSSQSSTSDPRGKAGVIRAAAIANGLNPNDVIALARAEGLGVSGYGNMDSGAMSYSALQMHIGGLADEYRKATGRDPADPANEDDLIRWGVAYGAKNGWSKWSSVTGGRVHAPRSGQYGTSSDAEFLKSIPGGVPFPTLWSGAPPVKWTDKLPSADVYGSVSGPGAPSVAMAQIANARTGVGNNSTSNDNSIENHVNAPVALHPPAGADAYVWGSAFADGLKRSMIVSNANTGTGG